MTPPTSDPDLSNLSDLPDGLPSDPASPDSGTSGEGKAERVKNAARRWWRDLQRYHTDGSPNPKADPAALARLRRCATPAEAMMEPATFQLFQRVHNPDRGSLEKELPRVALIAMILAHVRKDDWRGKNWGAARSVGQGCDPGTSEARMSPLRFRRLLACRDDQELAQGMRRLVALADGKVDVGDLARSLFFWTDGTRARWAFDYYNAGYAAPPSVADSPAIPAELDSSPSPAVFPAAR